MITEFQGTDGATRANFNQRIQEMNAHISDTANPHQVTAEQVGAETLIEPLIETLTSPSQLTHPGKLAISAMTADVNTTAANPMADYATGDFHAILLAKNVSDAGCQFGTLLVTSPRLGRKMWIGTILDYQFTDWQSTLSADIAKYASGTVPLTSPGLRNHIMIPKTDSIPTGLADGTIVDRYEP